jgi:hypothetical protein
MELTIKDYIKKIDELKKTIKEQEIKLKYFQEIENEYYLESNLNQEKQKCPTLGCNGIGNVKEKFKTHRT